MAERSKDDFGEDLENPPLALKLRSNRRKRGKDRTAKMGALSAHLNRPRGLPGVCAGSGAGEDCEGTFLFKRSGVSVALGPAPSRTSKRAQEIRADHGAMSGPLPSPSSESAALGGVCVMVSPCCACSGAASIGAAFFDNECAIAPRRPPQRPPKRTTEIGQTRPFGRRARGAPKGSSTRDGVWLSRLLAEGARAAWLPRG